ncbi:BadF/BadG/BcrA/BcrD ATPase family protein [Streptomyces sp. MBT42]|uniref:BadF/BadG/BcrA/BcrD ATPase family protein n=1 Tax=Streptomyces sp. MBT42 TaxID=1488373 RepID=UPI0027E028A5|nr:BadF/BadG/BcrA/BcrD ATPase family protein [Streptomyces sp. MBT42]
MSRRVMRFAIDSGGTNTRLAIEGPRRSTARPYGFGSLNPASCDAEEARASLRATVDRVAEYVRHNDDIPVSGILAGAAISAETLGHWAEVMTECLNRSAIVGEMVLTNDIDGLIVAPPVAGAGGVLVAGTGSGAMVMNRSGTVIRVGGWEYLASDEGSAFWMGRAGLAAAVRAGDGRGPATSVTDRIEADAGRPVREVARRVAEQPHPRQAVARFARCVTGAWSEDGDLVASGLVDAAVDELLLLVSTGMRRAGGTQPAWAVTGGLVVECRPFADLLVGRISALDPTTRVTVVDEPVNSLLRSRPLQSYPPGLVRLTLTMPA